MRVLWFTNTYVPERGSSGDAELRQSGGWMPALLKALQDHSPDLTMAVATARPARSLESYRAGDVDCFIVPARKGEGRRHQARALDLCAGVVRQWRPQVVHIHGTERFYGLLSAQGLISTPTVISLQGLVGPYAEWQHYFGNRTLRQIARMHRWMELAVLRGVGWEYLRFKRAARREQEILRGNAHFLGRTLWDRAHLLSANPRASYHHVGEVLRDPFWKARWALERCQRHRIIFTNAGAVRKGTETLFAAADLLRADHPALEVAVAGLISRRSGYGRHVGREIAKRSDYVRELGALNAAELAGELQCSHLFVSPSFIENSPNAVCEAQLAGVPVVTSYVGGVPSLVEEGKTGLFFPSGDAPCLAARIREVFANDELALRLSAQAREAASVRHDPRTIVRDLVEAYQQVLKEAEEQRGHSAVRKED
jgi:glycosyltransferase involved in cell wall biosynthesis